MPAMREDYYELLDAPSSADKQQLRAAYRRLAMRYHPDHAGDDPAAEERFKLIAEAWRVLGNDDSRADYDAWLERHRRYERLPELAAMPQKHARMSSRQGAERRRDRVSARESRAVRRPRPFLLRQVPKVGYLRYVLMCMCALLALQPFIRMYSGLGQQGASPSEFVHNNGLPPGESPLPPEERHRQLELYTRRLLHAAQAGDAQAQYRYGYILYHGIEGVIEPSPEAAVHWWWLSAAQGNQHARFMLNSHAAWEPDPPQDPPSAASVPGASTSQPEPALPSHPANR